jgi:8-oxo-dGTP diphosphatase
VSSVSQTFLAPRTLVVHTWRVVTYADVLAKNVRAARARIGLDQEPLAARMRALGYSAWRRQTVANVEKCQRRLTADELLGLALALETAIPALVGPGPDDRRITLPSGHALAASSIARLALRINDGSVIWHGDLPEVRIAQPEGSETYAPEESMRFLTQQHPPGLLPQQPIAAAIVTSRRGVLIARRNDGRPPWTFIAGEVEPGERPEDAAIREVKEETGLEIRAGKLIGERDHPATGRHMIYLVARPVRGLAVSVGDEAELAEVRWASLGEADELMPGMFGPVREHLAATIGGRP